MGNGLTYVPLEQFQSDGRQVYLSFACIFLQEFHKLVLFRSHASVSSMVWCGSVRNRMLGDVANKSGGTIFLLERCV